MLMDSAQKATKSTNYQKLKKNGKIEIIIDLGNIENCKTPPKTLAQIGFSLPE